MIMCKVLNARKVGKRTSATQVYIGRPSKWGNLRLRGMRCPLSRSIPAPWPG